MAVFTASLGVWQWGRAEQKQSLAQTMRSRAAQPALDALPMTDGPAAQAQWHRTVRLQGHWLQQHTVYLDNRQMQVQGQARVGFDVLTPLALADGTAVLVQRGWVARNFVDRSKIPEVPTPGDEVVVEGRYAPPPPRVYEFKDDGNPLGRVRQNVYVDAFSQEIGVALRPGSVVQTGDDAASTVLKRSWSLPDAGVARHHGYAFQWFALSALIAGLYVWFQLIRPRRTAAANRR